MASQRNNIAVFSLFILAATMFLSEASSLPRDYDEFIPQRDLLHEESFWKSKRFHLTPEQMKVVANCVDKRNDCRNLIRISKMEPYLWCAMHNRGDCDVTCGVDPCLDIEKPHRCRDARPAFECTRALLRVQCTMRIYKEGCRRTCCKCNELSLNCN